MHPALEGRGLIPPRRDDLLSGDVITGLVAARPRTIPAWWLWDERGHQLHERLAGAPEHYLVRAERALIEARGAEIGARLGPGCCVVEPEPVDAERSLALLQQLEDVLGYVPVTPSQLRGERLASELRAASPGLAVSPRAPVPAARGAGTFGLCAPQHVGEGARVVVWISAVHFGSVPPHEASAALERAAQLAGRDGVVLVGTDLRKAARIVEAAYDDRGGAAAAFARNSLVRVNREIGATFDVTRFTYRAAYDPIRARVEMRLVSDCAQRVVVGGHPLELARGEWIVAARTHAHDLGDVVAIARRAGLARVQWWTDPAGRVSLHLLAPRGGSHARA